MESQKGMVDIEILIMAILGAFLILVMVMFAYFGHIRADCVKSNTHRSASDVQVVCGKP